MRNTVMVGVFLLLCCAPVLANNYTYDSDIYCTIERYSSPALGWTFYTFAVLAIILLIYFILIYVYNMVWENKKR